MRGQDVDGLVYWLRKGIGVEKIGFSEGHTFITDFLGKGSVCIDLGANMGNFASDIEKTTEATIVSVEPVFALFDALPVRARRAKIRAIVQTEPGEMTINIYPNCCPSILDIPAGGEPVKETVICQSLAEILATVDGQNIGLVKVDIEGAEVDILRNTPPEVLRKAAQYTVEFHDFMAASLKPAVDATIVNMNAAGFVTIRFSLLDNTNILFVRKDMLRYGALSRFWLAGPVKYAAGIGRKLGRIGKKAA
jgi:FkbM family methyltransferase